jgi:hypothetical protein
VGAVGWTSVWASLVVTIAAFLLLSARADCLSFDQPTLVEVWKGGDDGLTNRLADALEIAFRASPNFKLSFGKNEGTLVVTIPTNLEWKQIAGRTKALFAIEFSSTDGRPLGRSQGSCWDNELQKCASQVVRDAKVAALRIH